MLQVVLSFIEALFVVVLFFYVSHAIARRVPILGEITGFKGKDLWEYLSLVGIPVVLAVAAYSFTAQQAQFSQEFTAQQNQTSQTIAANQQRETILENYLDSMSDLLLNHNLKGSKPDDAVRGIAQERTKVVLARMDPDRMALVVEYLYDQGLISGPEPIIHMTGAYLVGAHLGWAQLPGVNLAGAFLTGARLHDADLRHADLHDACLNDTNFTHATFEGTLIDGSDLDGANLSGTRSDQLVGTPAHNLPVCQPQLPGASSS